MILAELKLDYPTDVRTIAQAFGENANGSYARDGLKGHPAIDFGAPWGAPIRSASRGLGRVYKKFNEQNPDLSRYRAPCELIDLDDCVIEITYGHCNDITCLLGTVKPLQILATVGNTGSVFDGSHEVTEAEKEAGSHGGAHLHFQLRKCQKVTDILATEQYLQGIDGNVFYDGFYYHVPEYNNGYNGCIDPQPYLDNGDDKKIELMEQEVTILQKVVGFLKELLQLRK